MFAPNRSNIFVIVSFVWHGAVKALNLRLNASLSARLHWLASSSYGLWAFTRRATCLQEYYFRTFFFEGPSEPKRVGSGDVASSMALICSQVFFLGLEQLMAETQ